MNDNEIMKLFTMLNEESLKPFLDDTRQNATDYYTNLVSQGFAPESAMLETISKACYITLRAALMMTLTFSCSEQFNKEQITKEISNILKTFN